VRKAVDLVVARVTKFGVNRWFARTRLKRYWKHFLELGDRSLDVIVEKDKDAAGDLILDVI
jgi:hypothetical protein